MSQFLKSEPYGRNGQSVTLFELSALQRIEHLEYLSRTELTEASDTQSAVAAMVRAGAFIVAMSLWHGHEIKGSLKEGAAAEVARIRDEVLGSWPLEAIAEAEFRIKTLSGMFPPPEESPAPDDGETDGPVTAEKPLPVS